MFEVVRPIILAIFSRMRSEHMDAAYLTSGALDVTLFAISIDPLQGVCTELRPALANELPAILRTVRDELFRPRARSGSSHRLC